MKVRLEDETLKYRGIILTSETLEEKEMLKNLWINAGGLVSFLQMKDCNEIILAPSSEEAKQ